MTTYKNRPRPACLHHPVSITGIVAALTLVTATSHGTTTSESMDGTVHPADLGWTYFAVGNALPGTELFTAKRGGVITQNTVGVGFQGQGSNYYFRTVEVPAPSSWIMEARLRVLQSEIISFPFGSFVAFGNTGAGFQTNLISPLAGSWTTVAFDATVWRTYRWEVSACGAWTLFIDGELFTNGGGAQTSGLLDLAFGDGTGGANADAEYDFVMVTVNLGIGADFDGDGDVDGADLGTLLSSWDQPGITDLDCSGSTDGADLGILLSLWG